VRRGEKKVTGTSTGNADAPIGEEGKNIPLRRGTFTSRTDPNGLETVENWICVDDGSCPVKLLDGQSGKLHPPGTRSERPNRGPFSAGDKPIEKQFDVINDTGGASRFFKCFEYEPFQYVAKTSKRERENGLKGKIPCIKCKGIDTDWHIDDNGNKNNCYRNGHPTVKPILLLSYLCRLITPPDGVVLDPFMGSGSTGIACVEEDFKFIGIEKEKEYFDIAKARIEYVQRKPRQTNLFKKGE